MKVESSISFKRLALTKANKQMVMVAAVAAFITVLCLVAADHFFSMYGYQSKIIAADQTADNQLKVDVSAEQRLLQSYKSFVSQNPNILGTQDTTGKYRYNNATIILDALPSTYDFPALTSSIQKLLQNGNFNITSIGGQDLSATTSSAARANPQPIAIPFSFTIDNANYQAIQGLFQQMLESIRPLQIDSLAITGSDSSITLTVNAHTYFQPAKLFKIGSETISQ
ncbi:hypothetical protein M1512_02930 [Patescibacteria group bacterium]|nr:hypothetical protein [Patescibacteria group bacterium]